MAKRAKSRSTHSNSIMTPPGNIVLDELEQRIQGIAQELQDMIFTEYLDLIPNGIITISSNHKPPPQLHINRKTRRQVTEIYYRHPRVFTSHDDRHNDKDRPAIERHLSKWIRSLPRPTRARLDEVRQDHNMDLNAENTLKVFDTWKAGLGIRRFDQSAFKIKYTFYSFREQEWVQAWMDEKALKHERDIERHHKALGLEAPRRPE